MASSRSLGTLTLDLLIKTGAFVTGLDKAERTAKQKLSGIEKAANSLGTSMGKAVKGIAVQFAALAGVGLSVDAAVSSLKNAIDRADQLRDASIRLGVGVETLSAYGYAAQQTGTDIEELNKGLVRLAKNAQLGLKADSRQGKLFDALGISKESLSDLDKLVPQLADKFKTLEDGAQKAALAQELFGRSGANLIEFLNQGSDGLQTFADRAKELGIIIDQDTADAADNFNDKLGDLKTAFVGLSTEVASELLPQLTSLLDWAIDFVKDGENAAQIAKDVAGGFRTMTEAGEVFADLIDRLGGIRSFFADLENWNQDSFVFKLISVGKYLRETFPWLYKEIGGPRADFSGVVGSSSTTADTTPTLDPTVVTPGNDLSNRLNKFFSGGDKASKARKAAMSDEEKESKKLLQAYEQLTDNYAEQIALFGKEGEAARVRYDIEFGALKGLNEAQKESLILQAERLDTMRDEKEVAEELARIEDRRRENVASVLEDLQFESDALGKTVEQQEKMNLLRYAGVDANSAYGQSILDAADKYQELRKATEDQIQLMDAVRDSARGFFDDLYDGVGVVDALKNAFGNLADQIFKWAANGLIEKFFGQMGSTNGGASGDWLSSLFGSSGSSQGSVMDLFSGSWGYADGGYTGPGHRLQVAGVVHAGEYVMDASATSRIGVDTLDRLSAGAPLRSGGNTTNIYVQPTTTRRTADQIAQANERRQRTASVRNR